MAELRKQELIFEQKYQCDYMSFSQRTAEDEAYVAHVEHHLNRMWEIDMAEWEFIHKGIEDWTEKLWNILLKS